MDQMMSQPRQFFASLQVLRAVAAVAVVVAHLRVVEQRFLSGPALLEGLGRYADSGVDLFFVVSGFVMVTIGRGTFTGLDAACRFLVKRAWRILPLYWVFTTLVVILMAVVPTMVNSSHSDEQSILASYLLIPHHELPVLTVGWTLIHEAYFYLMFALALALIAERWLPLYLASWATLIILAHWTDTAGHTPANMLIASPLTLEFIAGALVALYWRRLPLRAAPALLLSGAVVMGLSVLLMSDDAPKLLDPWDRAACFGLGSVLLLSGAVLLEQSVKRRPPRWLTAVGDSSFSLYLTHVFVISAWGRLWALLLPSDHWLHHAVFLVTAVAASCVLGHAVHLWMERPLLALPNRLAAVRRRA